jgi:predicted homoserine dehydrogenase-like protein
MNLYRLLQQRQADGNPIRVGLIGAGKFGAMYLAQAVATPGIHILGIADLSLNRAQHSLQLVGWPKEQYAAKSFDDALNSGTTYLLEDAVELISTPKIDVVIDATGSPSAGVKHVVAACESGCDIIMVNVETDALVGPLLSQKAAAAGIVYSLAYGDQPALICEMVDWARAAGLEVVSAGKGTKYLPSYHASTPDTVWDYYGLSEEQAKAGGMNAQMFNSFLDGTKSGIEMAAVANATGLAVPEQGLAFPPCTKNELHDLLIPKDFGGTLERSGMVEVISSQARSGDALSDDLRWGVYAVFEASNDYATRCFSEYGLSTDKSGRYASMYKPYHLIGLELGISVASVALRKEPTGFPVLWQADVVATAKRALKAGEVLDGEGGYTVWGKLMSAKKSVQSNALPLGVANHCRLRRDIPEGGTVTYADVELDESQQLIKFRRELERTFEAH